MGLFSNFVKYYAAFTEFHKKTGVHKRSWIYFYYDTRSCGLQNSDYVISLILQYRHSLETAIL